MNPVNFIDPSYLGMMHRPRGAQVWWSEGVQAAPSVPKGR